MLSCYDQRDTPSLSGFLSITHYVNTLNRLYQQTYKWLLCPKMSQKSLHLCLFPVLGLKKRRGVIERESNRHTHTHRKKEKATDTHTERESKREIGPNMTEKMCIPSSLWRTADLWELPVWSQGSPTPGLHPDSPTDGEKNNILKPVWAVKLQKKKKKKRHFLPLCEILKRLKKSCDEPINSIVYWN